MNIRYRNFLMLTLLSLSFAAFAGSAQAQWEVTKTRTDGSGRLVFLEEKSARGIRTTTYNLFRGTNVVALRRSTTRMKTGAITVLTERRDANNRLTSILNEAVSKTGRYSGSRQKWRYQNAGDNRGLQTTERFDDASRTWVRI